MSDEKLDLILKELESMKSEQQKFKQEVSNWFDSLESKADLIKAQVAENAENITSIKENQVIIKDVIEQMATIQNRQEETINLLARRSIDQEAELRRIK